MTSIPSVNRIFAPQIGNLECGGDGREHGLGLLALGKRGDGLAPCRSADLADTGSLQLAIERQAARSRLGVHPLIGALQLSDRSAELLDRLPWPHRKTHGRGRRPTASARRRPGS